MCLIRSPALTANRPTLTIVVTLSGLQFCLRFIHFVFAHLFTSFSAFVYSLLSDDLRLLLIGYSLLDALFLIWLFQCLVIIRASVFYFANWLLFVWTCVSNHNWLLVIFITFFMIGISLLFV